MQDKTSILAATTPQDNSTYHAYLINVKDPESGKRIFNVVNLVEVCKSCLKTSKPWKCSHMSERISGSKSEAARKQTMLFYRPGQKHVAMRELMGQQSAETGGLIPTEWIENFHTSSIVMEDRPRAIYLGIDPGGGGPGELGVIGIAETISLEHGPRLSVIVMASISLQGVRSSDREKDSIITLIGRIRDRTEYQCPIVCAIESAPGIAASHIERYLREAAVKDLFIMSERKGYMEGVPKTEIITQEYVFEIQRHMCSGWLVYASNIITYHKKPEKEKDRLKIMMENLRKVPRKQQQEHGDQRFFITAKLSGQADDMLIALMMW